MPNLATAQKFSHDESGRHAPRESWPFFGNTKRCLLLVCGLRIYLCLLKMQDQRPVAHAQPVVLMMSPAHAPDTSRGGKLLSQDG